MKRLVLYIDGSSKGNPGPAGVGYVIENEKGEEVASASLYIGKATNNVAEYTALIKGLEKASEIGAEEVTVKTDSELIYRQVLGEYKVKNKKLFELYLKAMKKIGGFKSIRMEKIPREKNKADELAKRRGRI